MIPRGNAASTNRNVALFTMELTLFDGMGKTFRKIEGRHELFKWNHGVNFRFVREMFCYTVFTQMCMTDTTVHRGYGIPTQGTPHNVLGAMSGVHDLIGRGAVRVRASSILQKSTCISYYRS